MKFSQLSDRLVIDQNGCRYNYMQHNIHHQNDNDQNTTTTTNNDDDEDDHHHHKTTDAQTMMHILKANIGTGVLAMPLAFKNVGLWLGLVLVPLIGAICIHCMNILIGSHNRLCDQFNYESLDYDQVAALALACGPRWARRMAKRAHIVVSVFLMFTQIGFCCVYILFTVENLQLALLNLFGLDYSITSYLLFCLPIIGLCSCTSNLKHLARLSTLANLLQLFGLSLIFYDLLQFHTYTSGKEMDGDESKLVIVVEQGFSADIQHGLPLFFATAVYAFEGIGVVLPLIKEMQYPQRISGLNGVLNTSMSLVGLLYMAVGFFGYAKYGQTVQGSITLNLPETTTNELVRLAFALAIGFSYSLQFYVPWTIVWPLIDEALFYSYRPRQPRNKLGILQALNKENEWSLSGPAKVEQLQQRKGVSSLKRGLNVEFDDNHDEIEIENANDEHDKETTITITTIDNQRDFESMASTLASSYLSMPAVGCSSTGSALVGVGRYGSTTSRTNNNSGIIEANNRRTTRRRRNRLVDVHEGIELANDNYHEVDINNAAAAAAAADDDDDDDDASSIPDVQWRPPPNLGAMRGKRKLVRYTVILLTVSFTFVAAALIPRLDLIISLIGALASSCLAIIFPAIIQLCTFWNYEQQCQSERELDRTYDNTDALENERLLRKENDDENNEKNNPTRTSTDNNKLPQKSIATTRRRGANSFKWYLFVTKNCLLILFGLVGLLTGSYVSLAQLGIKFDY